MEWVSRGIKKKKFFIPLSFIPLPTPFSGNGRGMLGRGIKEKDNFPAGFSCVATTLRGFALGK